MLRTFRCLKTDFKANATIQGSIDLFIISLGLKIYGDFEPPKLPGCYGPVIRNIKQKITEQTKIHSIVAIVTINALDNAKRLLLYLWICLKRLIHLITIYYLPNKMHMAFQCDKISSKRFLGMISKS